MNKENLRKLIESNLLGEINKEEAKSESISVKKLVESVLISEVCSTIRDNLLSVIDRVNKETGVEFELVDDHFSGYSMLSYWHDPLDYDSGIILHAPGTYYGEYDDHWGVESVKSGEIERFSGISDAIARLKELLSE